MINLSAVNCMLIFIIVIVMTIFVRIKINQLNNRFNYYKNLVQSLMSYTDYSRKLITDWVKEGKRGGYDLYWDFTLKKCPPVRYPRPNLWLQ